MRETVSTANVGARLTFSSTTLKVQQAKETGKKECQPKELTFVESAQEIIDSNTREEETKVDVDQTG